MSTKIAILGAGVVGLSCAIRLVEVLEERNVKYEITILADKFDVETTSDGAGGLFRPDDRFMQGVPKHLAKKWSVDSFKYFHDILFSKEGGRAGIFQTSGYQLFDDEREEPSYKDLIYQFRKLTREELNSFHRPYKYGYFATTICVDPRFFMKYLTEKLVTKGVKFEKRRLETLHKFVNESDYDVVFNCLGLGAIEFCNDKLLVPIRGQMYRVKAPWVKHFYYTDDNCYIIPNVNTVCLGGTRNRGNFSLELTESDSKGIMTRCKELCPSLEEATVEWEWVGLRPHREPTRVEKEKLKLNHKEILVIHNYGHGGNGISLSRGTAVHAVDIFLEEANLIKSKL